MDREVYVKKIVAIVLIAVLVLSLGACGNKGGAEPTGDSTGTPSSEQPNGSSSAPDMAGSKETDEDFTPYLDEATGRYCSYLNVSFLIPGDWEIGEDFLNLAGNGAVSLAVGRGSGEATKMAHVMRRDRDYTAQEIFEENTSGHGIDPAAGHEVTYGSNKYYCNEGAPGDDGFVVYAYDGEPEPRLYIETNFTAEEDKAALTEFLTSFEYK